MSESENKKLPSGLNHFFEQVEELYLAGGGGAGGALPAAFEEAAAYGLDLKKVKRVVAVSVGVFVALAIALEIPVEELQDLLDRMPRGEFQDWDWWRSLNGFAQSWGWCKGKAMTNYFRKLIKDRTGLDDPTFRQLYEAGYQKELCIVTTNLSQGSMGRFSYKDTPDKKIAEVLTLACSVPLLYPPKWVVNAKGERELHTDGGVLNNYPWGVGSSDEVSNEKRLGFLFVNKAIGYSMDGVKNMMDSFWEYLGQVFWVLLFRHPLSLGDDVRLRTVAIQVNHPPLNFHPSQEEQAELSRAGREAVQHLIRHNLNANLKSTPSFEKAQQVFQSMAQAYKIQPRQEPQEKNHRHSFSLERFTDDYGSKSNLQPSDRNVLEANLKRGISGALPESAQAFSKKRACAAKNYLP